MQPTDRIIRIGDYVAPPAQWLTDDDFVVPTSLQDAPKPPWPSSGGFEIPNRPAGLTFHRILPRWRPHYPRRSSLRTPGPLRSTSGNAR
ncbi:hypothetical protein GS426_00165 [Rhodococcus hoagii]|nr:hypothetical protein [Prescottella equi]